MARSTARVALAATMCVVIAAAAVIWSTVQRSGRINLVAYFANSNGVFVGDEVRILGVAVGKIDAIEPQPTAAKISFWVDDRVPVPEDAKAVILSPSLVTARAIQLTPVYAGGSIMRNGTVIPQTRTAVPVEWDDLRRQLERLTDTLQPTYPGGVSTLGAYVNTTADNLRGQGVDIREAVIKLSQTFSVLGDHSQDIFGTVKNLSMLVSALSTSTDLMRELNVNMNAVTGLLANDPNEIANAARDINTVVGEAAQFVTENREGLGTATDRVASISKALAESLDDIKQTLHVAPNAFQDFVNIYQPAQGALTGALAINNFANPISFICGAIQAASRLNADQSSKLCVQYLAPIIKNRQWNFLPVGFNPFVGASARPNEITYSEPWLRPDYVPPQPASPAGADAPAAPAAIASPSPLPGIPARPGDPAAGLRGLLLPEGAGS
ncbi:MCE family protein [Mycobacterium vicinigordonae]